MQQGHERTQMPLTKLRPEMPKVAMPKVAKPSGTLARFGDLGPARSMQRDAVFRRLLAMADLCAAAGGLGVTALASGQRLVAASIATLPLIVLIMKIGGRYDHDEVVLRKSTLD